MPVHSDIRSWLRANGYEDVAAQIDAVIKAWHARGSRTKRNWWDVLAGDAGGAPKVIEGIEFPVLAVARRRQNLLPVDNAIERQPGELPPATPTARLTQSGRSSIRRASGPAVAVPTLTVRNFAQIKEASIRLEDLVIVIGPQATGKSLVLEFLKLALDRNRIVRTLKRHGYSWETPGDFPALYFGGGFENSWTADTAIIYGDQLISLQQVASARGYEGEDAVFYIPAHRTLTIAEGWPRAFTQFQIETPYVAKRFSEALLTALNQGLVGKGKIFPHERRLKDPFRELIDKAVFHGATLKLDVAAGMRKQFVLEYSDRYSPSAVTLPFMAWTAGQREFTPLLLGLYHLLPAGRGPKKKETHWAVIEEPEMGLHPKAIVAVMALVLDLLARGYKVAMSTHSPTVLEVVWGMSRLKEAKHAPELLCEMLELPSRKDILRTAAAALRKTHMVAHFQHDEDGRVVSKDISNLDPGSADEREWNWGGLAGFSARASDVIAKSRR